MLEDGGVAAERILPAAGEIERLLDAIGGGKRQDDSGHERNRPERDRDHGRGVRRDEHPHRREDHQHQAAQQVGIAAKGIRALGPGKKPCDFVLAGAAGEDAVRLELQAPVVQRGELGGRGLPRDDLLTRRGLQQPRREGRAPAGGCGGTKPLEERRATEEIQVERVRVIGQVDASGSVAIRQGMPIAPAPRQRPHVDEAQRVVAGDTLLDAGVPGDENAKNHEQENRSHERQRRRTPGDGPDQQRCGDEKRGEPEARDERRAAYFPLAVRGVTDGVLRVRNRCARHAACSTPAGFVPARFRRQ